MKKYILQALLFCGMVCPFLSAHAQHNVIISHDSTVIPPVELESFTVKATKEKNTLQQLPMSASVLKSRNVEQQEINNISELTSRIPNLFMPSYGSKLTSPIYIRGIGSRINSPSVGLYVDNVPYFEKAAFNFEFFDVERIEVLRGPQGTLYGRNTMGGIINIQTKEPMDHRSTHISINAGNYESYKVVMGHHQPISEKLFMLINAAYVSRDGYNENVYTGTQADDLQSYSARLRLQYKPSKQLKFDYALNYEYSDQNGYPYALYNDSTNVASDVNYDHESSYWRNLLSNSLTITHQTDRAVMKSITSHQYLEDEQDIDQDFTPADLFYVSQIQEQNMLSQEFYFQSNPDKENQYEWLCGAFGFLQYTDKEVSVNYGADAVAAYGLPGPLYYDKFYDQRTSGFALFHQSTVHDFITNGLSLTAGIRLDYEKSDLDYQYNRFLSGNQILDENFDSQLDFWEILPKVSLKYKITEKVITYATVSKGYKTGGFNTSFEREQDRTFDPEESWNYEWGVKSKYFKNRLHTNLSVFYIDWTKQQVYQPVYDDAGVIQPGSLLKNAGKSESKGVELEFRGLPSKHTEAFLSVGYTDAKFVDYVDGDDDFSGNKIPYIPEYTFHTGIAYTHQLDYNWLDKVIFHADYKGVGKHFWQDENISYQNYYGLLNAKITFEVNHLALSFWGKNILDEGYQAFYFQSLGNSYAQIGQPAIYGVKLDFKF